MKRETHSKQTKKRKKDRIKFCKIAPKKPTHKNLKIEARFLADFPMLHLYRMFAFLSNKTILHLLKCDAGASFLKIWLKFESFANMRFSCNTGKSSQNPD